MTQKQVSDGKGFEALVELIERSVSRGARIERDVRLPVISSKTGKSVQCDVVIWSGEGARKTLTLVEVQDRNVRVKPNDFRGWLTKIEDVGAQHLICVSRQPFPESIKESALSRGNTVRLIQLERADPLKIPLDLFGFSFLQKAVGVGKLHKFVLEASEKAGWKASLIEGLSKSEIANSLTYDGVNILPFGNLCISLTRDDDASGRTILRHRLTQKPPLYFKRGTSRIPVGVEIEVDLESKVIELPTKILSYEQLDHGVLAWVIEAVEETREGMVSWKVPLIETEDGFKLQEFQLQAPYKHFNVELYVYPPGSGLTTQLVIKSLASSSKSHFDSGGSHK